MYPETLTLEVTQEHIDAGEPLWLHKRPIALAMRGRGFRNPQAGKTWVWLPKSGKPVDVRYYPVGTHREEMEAWVRAFDVREGGHTFGCVRLTSEV